MALFGSSKPDHPMADLKLAKKMLAELPKDDAAKALDEVTFWIDSVARTEGFKPAYRYELFDLLDQTAKNDQRKLAQEYLATDRQEKFRENKRWNTQIEFWKTLGHAYGQCIEHFQSDSAGAGALKKDLPIILARAVRAATFQLKWMLLRYGPVDDRVWGDLGRLYLFAETQGLATKLVDIYPGPQGQGTVQQEFLKAMMVGVSSTYGLTPIRQDLAERIIAHFGSMYLLQTKPGPGCNRYYFDLSMRKPPARLFKGAEGHPMTRFFGPANAVASLEDLMREVRAKGVVPPYVNLGGSFDVELVLSVMQHVAVYWSDSPPARGAERHNLATRLTVVPGFDQMLRSVTTSEDDTSLDFESQDGAESWIVENVSESGFGAVIPPVKGDWIKVGGLIGVQSESAKFWGAAVVRRIRRDDYLQRHIGIQLLAKAVIPVKLAPVGKLSVTNTTREGDPAILMSTAPDKDGEIALLQRVGSFTPDQALEMSVRSKSYYLTPSKLIEGGDDFDWAKFKIGKQP
jgi:hypothetical protein